MSFAKIPFIHRSPTAEEEGTGRGLGADFKLQTDAQMIRTPWEVVSCSMLCKHCTVPFCLFLFDVLIFFFFSFINSWSWLQCGPTDDFPRPQRPRKRPSHHFGLVCTSALPQSQLLSFGGACSTRRHRRHRHHHHFLAKNDSM